MSDYTEQSEGFEINLTLEPEYEQPDWDFESEQQKQDLLDKIESGELLWFVAKVTASKCGVELAVDYIGGCCYKSIDDFIENSGYYEDMKQTCINNAKEKILELVK